METRSKSWILVACFALLLGTSLANCGEQPEKGRDSTDTDPNLSRKPMAHEFTKAEPEDIRRPKPIGEFARPKGHGFAGFLFTPDSRQLVMFGKDRRTGEGIIDIWEISDRKLLRTLKEPDEIAAVAFSPDGKRMVTACWDNKLRIYAAPDWQRKHTFRHDPLMQTANYLVVLADNKHFISGNVGYQGPRIWDLETQTAARFGSTEKEQVGGLAASRDGKRAVVAYMGPVAEVWNLDQQKLVGRLELAKEVVKKEVIRQGVFTSVAFSPDGKSIATGSAGSVTDTRKRGVVTIWDAATLKKRHETEATERYPKFLAYSSDGKLLVAPVNGGGLIYVWDAATGKTLLRFKPNKNEPEDSIRLTLSPDSRWLVTLGEDGVIRLWNFETIRRDFEK